MGLLLRQWRARRRWSQLDLALEAEISARHLSFLETGRAQPRREMVVLLADALSDASYQKGGITQTATTGLLAAVVL